MTPLELAGRNPPYVWLASTVHINDLQLRHSATQIYKGHRVSSATSYLTLAFNRSNLDIVVNTHVTKLLPVGFKGDKPIMRSVQFSQSEDGGVTVSLESSRKLVHPDKRRGIRSRVHFERNEGGYPIRGLRQEPSHSCVLHAVHPTLCP